MQKGGCFWERLAGFADAPALIETNGHHVSYRALFKQAEDFAEEIGGTRRLVFLEIENTVAALARYLGCLIGRHPVFLFGPADRTHATRLIERYRPNVAFADGTMARLSNDTLELHPDLRLLLSTSGSTGSAKLVRLSGVNLDSNAESIASYLGLGPSERAITLLKPHYSYGLSVLASHLARGASLVLNDDAVSDTAFWQRFRQYRVTSFAGVPYTFETLARMDVRFADYPSFRYATQAGGRLAPALVRHFAREAAAAGGRFFVMYGQTEAAPRMAYLPPEHAEAYPEAIGIAIPGGHISLVDESGTPVEAADTPGQLVYRGPNVMMGYAESLADLGRDDTPERLFTGDIARRNGAGLLTIVGRAARFVKLFGRRLNLDDVETHLRGLGYTAACTGNDRGIVVALENGVDVPGLAAAFDLPAFAVQIENTRGLPRLGNGKPDYRAILTWQRPVKDSLVDAAGAAQAKGLEQVFTRAFVARIAFEAKAILGLARPPWENVTDIFRNLVGPAGPNDSFASLEGDSMCYVQVSLALEELLGVLPPQWEQRTIAELEGIRDGII